MPESTPEPTPDSVPDSVPDPAADHGRARLRDALLRPGKRQFVVALLLAGLGFAFVVQVRDTQSDDTYAGLRENDLIRVFEGLTGTADRARREIERLEALRDELQDEDQARSAALDEAEQRLRTLNIIAGLVPVEGPGVRITITEADGPVSVGSLLDTVQELRSAGAEAMEFNDTYRLGAQSSFEEAVGGIELEGNLLESPYVLEVIGDQRVLKTALTFSSGPIETLETLDAATVTYEELDSVEIESVREPVRPQIAEPVEGQ